MLNPEEIKEKALSGFFWSMAENGGSYILNFLIGLVLVRLIAPVNYGIIGMMTFFISLSNILTDFGLSTALIQKYSPKNEDYSTVLWVNIFIALICYIVIFFISDLIAQFYSEPLISFTIKIFALHILISSLSIVHIAKINRSLNYKLWAKINLTSLFISGIIAIILAIFDYGIWALIFIQVLHNLFNTIQLWIYCDWNHGFKFSFVSLQKLLAFSRPLTLINTLNVFYTELYNLLVGRLFKAEKLAFYLRAKQTSEIFGIQFNNTLQKIMLPVMSNFQNDEENLKNTFFKIIILTGFINFSVLSFLSANGENLFVLLYTDKWLSSVPLFQFLCIEVMFLPLHFMAGNLLIARGKSKRFMYIELTKRFLQGIIIVLSLKSLETIVYGQIFVAVIYTIISFVIVQKEINISIYNQIRKIFPYSILAIIIFIINYINLNYIFDSSRIIEIFANLIISIIVFISISYFFKLEAYNYSLNIIKSKVKKKLKND